MQNEATAGGPWCCSAAALGTAVGRCRLSVAGYGSKAIARHLGLNHHTIGRWKHDPTFLAELDRLRALATNAAVAHAAQVAARQSERLPAPGTPRRAPAAKQRGDPFRATMSAEDRECEAFVDRILRGQYGSAARGHRPQA